MYRVTSADTYKQKIHIKIRIKYKNVNILCEGKKYEWKIIWKEMRLIFIYIFFRFSKCNVIILI